GLRAAGATSHHRPRVAAELRARERVRAARARARDVGPGRGRMNPDLAIVLLLLAAAVAMFVANRPRMDVVALLMIAALPLTGILTVNEALVGFGDPNVVLI